MSSTNLQGGGAAATGGGAVPSSRTGKSKTVECEIASEELTLCLGATQVLGKGGFGSVERYMWKGEVVAVKTVKNFISSALPSFCREIHVLNKQLPRHPNVVRVYGASMLEDGRLALVEELATRSLFALLHPEGGHVGQPIALADTLHIAVHLARGLAHVHSNNLSHNDLKSANVLLFEATGRMPIAKLADFGLVRRVAYSEEGASGCTLSTTPLGLPFGTPIWMAPENHEPKDMKACESVP
jgi:serine/threonine protein kinase